MIVAALDQAQATQVAPQQVIGIVNTLIDYLNLGGHWRLGMRLISWQLKACREVGNRNGEGAIPNNLGQLAYSLGQPEQALVIRREVGDRNMEGTTLNNLGELARSLGQPEEARGYYEQALAIAQEIGAIDHALITRIGAFIPRPSVGG